MKLFISTFSMACFVLLNSTLTLAVDCPDSSYTLTTQAQVDNFPADCDTVAGYLRVEGGGITNLNGLANLSVVGGNLEIINNPGIRFLRLPALTRVDGYFQISGNKALVGIDGLTNLSTVRAELSVSGVNLSNLEGLEGLVTTGGLFLHNAPLRNLGALGSLREAGYITLQSLPELQNVDGLKNITRTGNLTLDRLGPSNLDGFRNVTQIEDLIVLGGDLSSLDGLSGLNTISGDVRIKETALRDIDGLAGVTGPLAGRLEIRANSDLAHIDGLFGVTAVTGTVLIVENDSLRNISGIRNLREVDEDFIIAMNPSIQSVPDLSLRFVRRERPGGLQFWGNGDRDMDCRGFRRILGYPVGPPYDGVRGQIEFERAISRIIGGRQYSTYYKNCGGSYTHVVPPLHRPEEMAQLYIGFLGRAPDPAGLVYWTRELYSGFGSTDSEVLKGLKKLANDITQSSEWASGIGRYNPLTQSGAEAIVAEMYLNLFSRPATASDLEYWSYDLTSRHVTSAEMAVLLINGAMSKGNTDSNVLRYKHQAALYYTARVDATTFDRRTARLAVKDVSSSSTLQESQDASDKL